jgi:peptidase M28-like protein
MHRDVRQLVEALCRIERPSASAGERASAEWIVGELGARGLEARMEEEAATGSYWLPYALLSAAGLLGAGVAAAGRRRMGAALAGAAAVALVDDLSLGRRWARRALRRRRTWNVVCEIGEDGAKRTVALVAHHDAARSGFIFDPSGGERLARRAPWLVDRLNTDPPVFWPVIAGPALVAGGSALGRRGPLLAGAALSAAALAVFCDVGRRPPVPGAIDNASGVAALLALAGRLCETPPERVRVLLVFTGSEEALWEGMEGFAARHFGALPKERTFFLNVDQVGDRRLCFLRGEGAVRMRHYREDVGRLVHEVATGLGIEMPFTRLRSRTGSDAQYPAKAGYPTASLQSVTEAKLQTAYHWPTDTPDVVDYGTLADAVRLCEGIVRRLDKSWLTP